MEIDRSYSFHQWDSSQPEPDSTSRNGVARSDVNVRSNNRTYKYRLHAVLVLTYMRFRVLVLDEITHGSPTHSTDRRNYSGQALQCCVFAQLKLVLDICLASRS